MSSLSSVWDRQYDHPDVEMSKNLYALGICGFTLAGIITSLVAAQISKDWVFPTVWHMLGFLVGVAVIGIVGVVISLKSDKPGISLLGYAMVAGPFGLMLGPILSLYTTASIVKVLFITSALVAILGMIGAMIPESLEGWGSWLMGGLIILLIGYLVVPIAGAIGVDVDSAMTWLDWIGVALFSGMVIYDWNRAMRLPRTLDNSIDVAVAIYLDWFNLFIRLLSLMGQRSD